MVAAAAAGTMNQLGLLRFLFCIIGVIFVLVQSVINISSSLIMLLLVYVCCYCFNADIW